MTVRIWTKRETQSTIKQLRQAGYDVRKSNDMYKIIDDETGKPWIKDDCEIFCAMGNASGYLVHYHPDLME